MKAIHGFKRLLALQPNQHARKQLTFLNASVDAYQRGDLSPEAASALKLHTSELMGRVADQ